MEKLCKQCGELLDPKRKFRFCPKCREKKRKENLKRFNKIKYVKKPKLCEICGAPLGQGNIYCRTPPCKSALFGKGSKSWSGRSLKTEKTMDKKTACRVVTCEPLNKYRDRLFEIFHPPFSVEDFNKVREIAMKTLCGTVVLKPFIVELFREMLGESKDAMSRDSGDAGVTTASMRTWERKINQDAKQAISNLNIKPRYNYLDRKKNRDIEIHREYLDRKLDPIQTKKPLKIKRNPKKTWKKIGETRSS